VRPALGSVSRALSDRAQDVIQGADFGMICNGKAGFDNTPKFVDAMNAAFSLGGRTIVPPPGVCRFNTAFTALDNLSIDGRGLSTFYLDPNMTTGTYTGASYGFGIFNVSNIRINGVTWQGGGNDTPTCPNNANGIPQCAKYARVLAINARYVTVQSSTFRDFGKQGRDANANHTSYMQGLLAFGGSDWLVDNSKFINNSGDGIAWSNNAARVEVRSSYFENNGDSGPVCTIGGTGFNFHSNYIIGQAGSPAPIVVMDRCTDWHVDNNTILGVPRSDGANTGQAVRVARYPIDSSSYVNRNFTVNGNSIFGTATAISVENAGTTQAGYTDANTGTVYPAVSVPGGGKFALSGNTASGPDVCIDIVDAEFGSINGNACSSVKSTGLRFISYSQITGSIAVGPNTFNGTNLPGSFGIRQVSGAGGVTGKIAMTSQIVDGFLVPQSMANANTPTPIPTLAGPPANTDCAGAGQVLGMDTEFIYACVAFNALRKVPLTAP
jgi:hypothetical protein